MCHKKLGDLESYTKQNLSELIKQISFLQKNYLFITNYLKLDNKKKPYDGHFINSSDTQELNTIGNGNKTTLNIRLEMAYVPNQYNVFYMILGSSERHHREQSSQYN